MSTTTLYECNRYENKETLVMTALSEKRKQMQGIIQNIENNLDIAVEQYSKTGDPSYQFQIDHYGKELKRLRDEVWDHERELQGQDIRDNMTLMSVGYGFVGSAVGEHIAPHIKRHIIVDPAFNENTIEQYAAECEAAVVVLPTPTVDGKCDDSLIRDTIERLNKANPGIKILLKSTVPPDQLQFYPDNVTYNPEFLRAATAKEDYENQEFIILGGFDRAYWHRVFLYMGKEVLRTDRTTASMVKYMHNTWLAMKVAYFHEVYQRMGKYYDHNEMIEILAKFKNMGPSHMMAPNDMGGLGYSGYCFPKDTEAFYEFTGSEILERVIEVNRHLLDL